MNQENNTEPNVDNNTEPTTSTDEVSGLPSETETSEGISFEINPEDIKDGKFQGRWKNPNEMAEYIKSLEDKHADLNRDIKNKEKKTDEDISTIASEVKQKELQDQTIKELLPTFLENDMVVTDEMKEKLIATGLSEQDIKLGAYELKEAIDKNASYVGGKENYDVIMNYHAENMTDEEKIAFNHSIQDPKNSKALMIGLQTLYERSINNPESQEKDRVRGNSPANTNTIKPYESKAELLRDKAYVDSRRASSADKARFKARLRATPENVWLS